LEEVFRDAVRIALIETEMEDRAGELNLPEQCPFTLNQLLADDVSALWRK
jgi:hypothetical protein